MTLPKEEHPGAGDAARLVLGYVADRGPGRRTFDVGATLKFPNPKSTRKQPDP